MNAALADAGLTMTQAYRLSVCAKAQGRLRRPFCFEDLSEALDVEGALAARFMRQMNRSGFLVTVRTPSGISGRRCQWFLMGGRWLELVRRLATEGIVPGVCAVCLEREPLPFMFMGRFLCRECLCADTPCTSDLKIDERRRKIGACKL